MPYIAAIAHDPELKEVEYWAVAPSSSIGPNPVLNKLKEHIQFMMCGEVAPGEAPLFIRHKAVTKARFDQEKRKEAGYWQKHLSTIMVNKEYRGKMEGRVVCIIDDYLDHGNMFETLRNLLIACQVKKIFCIAIGKFLVWSENTYTQKTATFTGDVYSKNNNANVGQSFNHAIQIDPDAQRSLRDLKPLSTLDE